MLEDKEFVDSLKDENDDDGFFKNLKEKMVTSALDAYIVKPLRETYKGNFIEFLLDFTDKKKASILSKLVFKTLQKIVHEIFYCLISSTISMLHQ